MCGRFTQQRPTSEIAAIFEAEDLADDPGGRFNVAPTDEAAVVVQRDERRAVVALSLGPRAGAGRTTEERVEDVQRPGRDPRHRAGCSATRSGAGGASCRSTASTSGCAKARPRQPMRIHDPDGRRSPSPACGPAARTTRRGEWHRTFTIVTTRPNAFMAPSTTGCRSWCRRPLGALAVDPTTREPGELRRCSSRATRRHSTAYPVSPLVNNVRNNGPELVEPAAGLPPEPPTLL